MELTFASMFAGCGGGDLGLIQAGWRCVWSNEIDKSAAIIYRKNLGEKHLVEADIRDVRAESIPDFTLLIAGFPCQSFSLAGKREGTDSSRGTLFAQIVRVANVKRPPFLLLENVKGLLSSDNGGDFAKILRALGNMGYILQWQVLNSKCFLPQNRERVFVIGCLGEQRFRQIFPIPETDEFTYEEVSGELPPPPLARAITATEHKQHGDGNYVLQEHSFSGKDGRGRGVRVFEGYAPTLAAQMGTGGNNVPLVVADRTRSYAGLGRNLESPKHYSNTISGVQKDNLLILNHAPRCGDPKVGGTGPLLKQNECFTVDSSPYYLIGKEIRRFTPSECESLQGFPKGYTEGVSDTQRYKMVGNAMTVPVIKFLGERLKGVLDL